MYSQGNLRHERAAFVGPRQIYSARSYATSSPAPSCFDPRPVSLRKVSESDDDDTTNELAKDQRFVLADKRVSLRDTLGQALMPQSAPQIVGHRGALYEYLENTLAGFEYCAALGCHAVELDVFLLNNSTATASYDNLICFHGGGGDAMPGNLKGYVLNDQGRNIRDLDWSDIQNLQFNPAYPEFACPPEQIVQAKIPTLQQVLGALRNTGTRVQIELKSSSGGSNDFATNTDVLEPCIALVEQLEMMNQVRFSSFDHALLKALHELRPEAILGALFTNAVPTDYIQIAKRCGASEVHLRYDTCTAARVAEIHAAGLGSLAWVRGPVGMTRDGQERFYYAEATRDGEDADCYRAILDTGVQQVCCNKPDLLKQILVADGRYTSPSLSRRN